MWRTSVLEKKLRARREYAMAWTSSRRGLRAKCTTRKKL